MVLGAIGRAATRAARSKAVEGGGSAASEERGGAFAKVDDDNWVILVRTGVTGGMLVEVIGVGRTKAEPAACAAIVSGS